MRKYRRQGVGKFAAVETFNNHQGNWQVGVLSCNTPSLKFWKKVISEYSNGKYGIIKKDNWDGIFYTFGKANLS